MSNEQTDASADEALDGVSGLGAARKALLHAAGITTRTELARMDVDRLMRVARMPRNQAARTLASLSASAGTPSTPPPKVETPALTPPEPTPEADPLQVLIARLQALQEEAARAKAPHLVKPLSRLAGLLEDAPERMASLGPKHQRSVTKRLTVLVDRLEKAILSKGEISPKREQQLRGRLREERRALADALGLKPRRKPKKNGSD